MVASALGGHDLSRRSPAFFITWIAFVEAELLPRGDSPTLVMVDLSQAAIFIVAWVLVAILGAQVFV